MAYLFENDIDGYVADTMFRKRDPRFASAERHKPSRPNEPWARPKRRGLFMRKDFISDGQYRYCVCPAGKRLYRKGAHVRVRGNYEVRFTGASATAPATSIRELKMLLVVTPLQPRQDSQDDGCTPQILTPR